MCAEKGETPDSPLSGQQNPPYAAAVLYVSCTVQKMPRLQRLNMWKLGRCVLCLFVCLQLTLWSVWVSADEQDGEVKIEVLFKPEPCSPKSKRGDLMNVHYDGFLAKDGSQFYCRLVG